MLPRATNTKIPRATQSSRTIEISRLIGRSLRATVDLTKLGDRQIIIACDIIQADADTRTCVITDGYIALSLAVTKLITQKILTNFLIVNQIVAISVGIVNNITTLGYAQDLTTETDMNVVINHKDRLIEVQGTAEKSDFSAKQLEEMLSLAHSGILGLFKIQNQALKEN